MFLSTKPEKFVGTDENWQKATDALRLALEKCNLKYTIDPGEGVFYGPKIDIKIKDSIGRVWQCSTIQVDFNLPERFDVNYIGEDGKEHRVVMIHRAIFGSLERFFGILIEHWAGSFPVWLSPIQARIIPITDSQIDYAKELKNKLSQVGLRADIDTNSEKMGSKIRSAELEKFHI